MDDTRQRARVEAWLEEGRLLHPLGGPATTVDLIRTLFARCGLEGLPPRSQAAWIDEALGPARHWVFVLVDGLGRDGLELAPSEGLLRSGLRGTLRAVFPSTTAAALTSFATGRYPAAHGVVGWWVRLPTRGLTTTALRFVERSTGRPLDELGVAPGDLYVEPSLLPRLPCPAAHSLPAPYAHSTYSRWTADGVRVLPYDEAEEAPTALAAWVAEQQRSTFSWLYLPAFDHAAHVEGARSEEARAQLQRYEALLGQLRRLLPADARVVVSADHGHADVPNDRKVGLSDSDPLLDHLTAPPSGEPTVPIFHALPGHEGAFAAEFLARFGTGWALLRPEDLHRLGLLGPGRLGDATRARLGSFVALAPEPSVLVHAGVGAGQLTHRGFHAGLTPAEIEVPLVVL